MTTAIVIIIGLAVLDAMIIIGCFELEKREEERERKRNGKIH